VDKKRTGGEKKALKFVAGDVEGRILVMRGVPVVLDRDLAKFYGVSTTRLNQQVARNCERFPEDFMFQLSPSEARALMLQNATSKKGRGGPRKLPYAFTEHGALRVEAVLRTPVAVEVGTKIIRAFVKMRAALVEQMKLTRELRAFKKTAGRKFATVFYELHQHEQQIKSLKEGRRED
jgi:hypothetical protein